MQGAGDSPFTCSKHPGRAVGPPDRPGSCTQCVGEMHLRRQGEAAARGRGEYVHIGAKEDSAVDLEQNFLAAPAVHKKRKAIMSIRKICVSTRLMYLISGVG